MANTATAVLTFAFTALILVLPTIDLIGILGIMTIATAALLLLYLLTHPLDLEFHQPLTFLPIWLFMTAEYISKFYL